MRRETAPRPASPRSDARRPLWTGVGSKVRVRRGVGATRRVLPRAATCLITAGFAWATLATFHNVSAQGVGGGPGFRADSYRSRPTLSPYLDLLRVDSGVIPPYHAFVVPRRTIEQQQARQGRAISDLRRRSAESDPGREPLPTGRGGQFQNTLHFYPQMNVNGRPQAFGRRR